MADRSSQDMKEQLQALKGELIDTLDPARAKKLRDEMVRVAHEIRGAQLEASRMKEVMKGLETTGSKAGKGATESFSKLSGMLGTVGSVGQAAFAGLTGAVISTVAVANPAAFLQFTLALRDLAGVVGQILSPVLAKLTEFIRGLADFIITLSPATKAAVAAFVGFGVVLGSLLALVPLVILGINGITAAAAALNVSTGGLFIILGVVVTALAALVAGAVALASKTGFLSNMWDKLSASFAKVEAIFSKVAKALEPLLDWLTSIASMVGEELLKALEEAGRMVGHLMQTLVELLNKGVGPLAEGIGNVLMDAFKGAIELIRQMIAGLERLIDVVRELAGLPPIQDPEVKRDKRSSLGAGGRRASFISNEALQKKAIEATFSMGIDPDKIAQAQRREMIQQLQRLNNPKPGGWDADRDRF